MRELTQQEIDSAPDWATHYTMDDDGEIFWLSKEFAMTQLGTRIKRKFVRGYLSGCHSSEKPIPRKPFDIGEYRFDGLFYQGGSACRADFNIDIESFSLHKTDVIALAKHFKLI